MNKESALEQIKKLLKLANDQGATEAEAKAALGRASHLARKFNVSDIEIERAQGEDMRIEINIDPSKMVRETVIELKSLSRWDKMLVGLISKACNCGGYISSAAHQERGIVYGLPQDVAVARELFKFLRDALAKNARSFAKMHRDIGIPMQSNNLEVRSYKDGFVSGMFDTVRESQKDEQETTEVSGALVLITDIDAAKQTALEVYRKNRLPKLHKARTRARLHDSESFRAGKLDGRRQSISRGVIQ